MMLPGGKPVEPRPEPRPDWEARQLERVKDRIQNEEAEAKLEEAELRLAQIKADRRGTEAEQRRIE